MTKLLSEITPQEEIFCQHYVITVDSTYSAYQSGMSNSIKLDVEYENLTLKQRKSLSRLGNIALKKDIVKQRISEIARIEAEKNSCATLEEILSYLTIIIRRSKNKLDNIMLINSAIKAIETLIKRYPDFAEGEKEQKYYFKRGV